MDFKIYTIDPKGRQKYGTYVSSQKTTQMVTTNVYNGNDTTTSLDNQNTGPAGIYLNYPFESGGTWWIGDTDTGIPYSPADIINIISGRWFINNTDTGILVAYADGREKYWLLFLDKTVGEVEGSTLATTPQTITVTPIGYTSNQRGAVYVGNLASDSAQTNYCITGLTDSGMTVVVSGNGTSAATINITFDNTLTPGVTAGTLQIPCNVYMGSIDPDRMGNDYFKWMENAEYVQEAVLSWSWVMNVDSVSLYTINLTNDSAMVNCDINGNVLPGALRPTCTIQLFYGDTLTSATYYEITYNSIQAVSGLSVNHSTGEIIFGSDFNFLGTSLEITCKCVPNAGTGYLDQEKIMTVTKAFPGADGASGASGANAVSRWISLSADAVAFNSAGTPNPSVIYATCYKQVGEDPVEEDTATTIYYGYGTSYPTAVYTTGVTVNPQLANYYLTFGLRNAQNRYYELETVAFVRDGMPGPSGQTGEQGRQGAAIRGPRKWSDLLQYVCEEDTMRMCNGHYDAQHPEDGQWLDIIIQDMDGTANTIYYCNTSFDMECQEEEEGATWNAYKQNFTSGESFDFVATNVLLANEAQIDFLTGNEINLGYRNNTGQTIITAGARGGSGSSIAFWAGNTEQNPTFSVDHNGNLIAHSASISGNVYATDGVFSGSVYATNGVFSGTVYADAGRFAGNVWVPFTKVEELDRDGNYFVLSGKTHIIKDDWSSTARALLPAPSSALNGFCYDILLVPPLTQMTGELRLKTYGNYQIYNFCSTSLATNAFYSVTLNRGNFKFVCLYYGASWTWALVDVTPNSYYEFSTSSNI